ncbi:reverse transcriptase domain-containing protein [Tanacetum coccineum]
MAHDSMDPGAKVARNANNKRKRDNNSRDNRVQQPPYKRQNVCRLHHSGPCTVKCNNCKRIGHKIRDCRTFVLETTQRVPIANQKPAIIYFGCDAQGHFRSDCPKLKNQNRMNQIWKEKAHRNSNVVKDKTDA